MEGAGGTASLCKAAAHWSLAGDKQLLDLLQNLHERIVTKCQEANSSLEEMVNTLDTASISLQNVNNRLMALSNSQFVESRVYEDDVDVAARDPPVKEPSKPAEATSDLIKLRDSLRVLEAYHEPVHIVDSDSESISDEEDDRMVLKPKDLYCGRPLPYVIGSQQWRCKWHAGLVAEDSDTESDTSKANPPSEQYSDSEPDAPDVPTDRPHASQRTISTTSSIGSELTIPTVGRPADIAAELARRLGGAGPHVPEPEPESPPTAAVPAKVYRPQQPATATIFSDEPPPLDSYQSDQSDQPYRSDSEDDVFAELHRTSHRQPERAASAAVDQLFVDVSNVHKHKDGLEDDGHTEYNKHPSAKLPSPLLEESQHSELFVDKPKPEQQSAYSETQPEASVKKPVGGISLFGNNQGTESIGAAILKRNQRKVSTSDEDIDEPSKTNKINDYSDTNRQKAEAAHNSKNKIQKDIINDLFSKSNKTKQATQKNQKISAVKIEKPVNKKVDLFTDDLFDDIDNIFTNVKPPVKETKDTAKKSLFDDDDDDDLFANVATTSNKPSSKPESKSKSIFDSDDDLFSENITAKLNIVTNSDKDPQNTNKDTLFGKNSDNIDKTVGAPVIASNVHHTAVAIQIQSPVETNELQSNILTSIVSEPTSKKVKSLGEKSSIKSSKDKTMIDIDSDDDIFSDLKSANNNPQNGNKHKIINEIESPYNTDEDSIEHINSGNISHSNNINDIRVINENDELSGDESLFKQSKKPLDSIQEILTPQNKKNYIDCNVSNIIDKIENNTKTSNEILTDSIGNKEDKKPSSISTEDQFPPGTDRTENIMQKLPKTQLQSPSLFDEDDDLDDIFSKNLNSNEIKNTDRKLQKSNFEESSDFTINSGSSFLHKEESSKSNSESLNKSDNRVASNKNSNLVPKVNETEINKSGKTEKPSLTNDNPVVFKDISKDLKPEIDTNPIENSLLHSEVILHSDDSFDNSLNKKAVLGENTKNKTEYDISTDSIQKERLFSNTKESISGEPDIFSDVFSDVPPEFERPKEPKRSKNVNALFDDDSDDEALFFKKNEIVSDEKPDISFISTDDRLFHIFHDEPPSIDVDFTQKSNTTSGFKTKTRDTFEINSSQTNEYEGTVESFSGEEIHNEPDTLIQDQKSVKTVDEAKKPVGKLKSMNFNINVCTLLPGASPKKTKTYEQVDGQIMSTKNMEDGDFNDEESKLVKSVSFEGDPESEILDNKLSKERAKIQVKRRPSSRRARKEAVRKSGIDFGDDSTDTSSSADISKKETFTHKKHGLQTSSNTKDKENSRNTPKNKDLGVDGGVIKDVEKCNINITDENEVLNYAKPDVTIEKDLKNNEVEASKLFNNVDVNNLEYIKRNTSATSMQSQEVSENSNLTTVFNKRPNVTSKVVYILNDEDIFTDTKPFTNSSVTHQNISEGSTVKNKVLNIVDDDDELFKSSVSKNTNIAALGSVSKDVDLKSREIDNFDSNDDIFKASQSKLVKSTEITTKYSKDKDEIDKLEANVDKLFVKTQGTKVKSSLFDDLTDDESELFGNKKPVKRTDITDSSGGISTIIKKEVKIPKSNLKQSLFGNESDDDDLFAVKSTRKEPSQPRSKPKEVSSKPTEPVFEDPLSRLTQEEDM